MAKTKEELEALKKEYESLKSKLDELSEAEMQQVCGGVEYNKDDSAQWNQGNDLPAEPGSYRLPIDIKPSDEWKLPEGKKTIE